jgi:hypothetical protein
MMSDNVQFGKHRFRSYGGDVQLDIERIESALSAIPPDDRTLWLEVGMALHAAYLGASAGKAIWDRWSSRSNKFDPKEQDKAWRISRQAGRCRPRYLIPSCESVRLERFARCQRLPATTS